MGLRGGEAPFFRPGPGPYVDTCAHAKFWDDLPTWAPSRDCRRARFRVGRRSAAAGGSRTTAARPPPRRGGSRLPNSCPPPNSRTAASYLLTYYSASYLLTYYSASYLLTYYSASYLLTYYSGGAVVARAFRARFGARARARGAAPSVPTAATTTALGMPFDPNGNTIEQCGDKCLCQYALQTIQAEPLQLMCLRLSCAGLGAVRTESPLGAECAPAAFAVKALKGY